MRNRKETTMPMTEAQFGLLQYAVQIARERQIRNLERLLSILREEGYPEDDIKVAIGAWVDYENAKTVPLRQGTLLTKPS